MARKQRMIFGIYREICGRIVEAFTASPVRGNPGRWRSLGCDVLHCYRCRRRRDRQSGYAAPVNHALDEVIALHVLSAVWKSSRRRKEGAMTKLRVHLEDDNDDVRGTFQERLESYCKNIQRAPTGAAAGFSWRPG